MQSRSVVENRRSPMSSAFMQPAVRPHRDVGAAASDHMPTRIRPAAVRDIPAITKLAFALACMRAEMHRRRFTVPRGGARALHDFFEGELARPLTVLEVAEYRTTPVGYAFIRMERESFESMCAPSAWLCDVYVDPLFRGGGAGRELVFSAIESARHLRRLHL